MPQPRRTPEQMYPLVEVYLQSGQTQNVFCTTHGLSEAVLNYWLAKYRRAHSSSVSDAFVEIASESPTGTAFLEVDYPGGVRLRFFAPVSPLYLAQLLS